MIKLIVGLGNPGPQYQDTRHNAGAWFVSQIGTHHSESFKIDSKFKSLMASVQLGPHLCKLAIPTTYMNLSGDAVLAIARFYNIDPPHILIAHDELDLPAGVTRLKWEGGHGGHNGLRDIFAKLGTRSFYRLRIGIGHPGHKDEVSHYVLHKPSIEDKKRIMASLNTAEDVLPYLLDNKLDQAMKLLHTNESENN